MMTNYFWAICQPADRNVNIGRPALLLHTQHFPKVSVHRFQMSRSVIKYYYVDTVSPQTTPAIFFIVSITK